MKPKTIFRITFLFEEYIFSTLINCNKKDIAELKNILLRLTYISNHHSGYRVNSCMITFNKSIRRIKPLIGGVKFSMTCVVSLMFLVFFLRTSRQCIAVY